MKFSLPLLAATAAFAFAAPTLGNAAVQQSDDAATETQAEAQAETAAETNSAVIEVPAITAPAPEAPAAQEAEEEEVICRSIRLDMSSRRKTRVCRTEEGWRQLNQRR